jgi:hypothetical protein
MPNFSERNNLRTTNIPIVIRNDAPDDFIPVGKKTQPYIINLSRTRIFWQPEGISVF